MLPEHATQSGIELGQPSAQGAIEKWAQFTSSTSTDVDDALCSLDLCRAKLRGFAAKVKRIEREVENIHLDLKRNNPVGIHDDLWMLEEDGMRIDYWQKTRGRNVYIRA